MRGIGLVPQEIIVNYYLMRERYGKWKVLGHKR